MKKISHLLFPKLFTIFILIISTFDCKADTIVWSGNIELNADQQFTQQQTLKVMPGTVVIATGAYKIEIRGNILAEGTVDNPIIFTASDTIGLYDSATIAGGWHGIHLINNDNGQALFVHCRFEYGKANIPGSWYEDQAEHDTLSGNQGGAIRITDYNNIVFSNCEFFYNFARSKGGGIYFQDIQRIVISECNFSQNKVMVAGGAIFCGSHQYFVVDYCTFKLNISWSRTSSGTIFSHGSAIYLDSYPPDGSNIINNSSFFNNYSLSTLANYTSESTIVNNVFTNNYNLDVVTYNMLESSHLFINNTIANNFYIFGIPGVFNFSEDLHFYNNIMWNNLSDDIGADDKALTWFSTQPDVNYNLVWEDRIDGENTISDNPLFINPAPGFGLESNGWEFDWSLMDNSPAVNAGTPDTNDLNLPSFDLAGNPRVFGNRIDIGAYENQHVYVNINDSPVSEDVKLFPNPGKNTLIVQILPETKNCFIDLYNNQGAIIMHHQIENTNTIISTESLPAGIYHYRIYDQNKRIIGNSSWIRL